MPTRNPNEFGTRLVVLSTLLILLLIVMYAGVLALLMRFAMVNHRSTERGAGRVWTQVSWMAGSLVMGSLLWVGTFVPYREGIRQLNEAAGRAMMARFGSATFDIEDGGKATAQNSIVMVFSEVPNLRGSGPYFAVHADREGRFTMRYLRPGVQYSAVAIAKLAGSVSSLESDLHRNLELRERLRESAVALMFSPGESTTVTLKLTEVP